MARNKAKNLRMEEIVTAAVEEFLEKGYEKASMEHIALQSAMDGLLAYLMFDESISREGVIRGFRVVFINDILRSQDI